VTPTNDRFGSHPNYQNIQINLQENLLKAALVSLFASSLRSSVPERLWSKYIVSRQNMEYERDPLGMVNNRIGYVYLVDENLKVRWAACADAKEEETRALENCTAVLLSRLDRASV
jgi:mitochondrial ATPase complex subunit ATP10